MGPAVSTPILPELLSPEYLAGLRAEVEAGNFAASGEQELDRYHNLLGHISALERAIQPAEPRSVVVQLVSPRFDSRSGLRLVIDGEVVDTGDFGGEPEDNCEYRDYKWVKLMLACLARKLGAEATIETVDVDGDGRAMRERYYAAMAAPYVKPEAK